MSTPEVALSTRPVTEAETDAVVVTVTEDGMSAAAQQVDEALDGLLTRMRETRQIRGRFAESTTVHPLDRMPTSQVMVLGLGRPEQLDTYRLHNAFQFAGRRLRQQGARGVTAYVDQAVRDHIGSANGDRGAVARAVVTGLALGNFHDDVNKSEPDRVADIDRILLAGIDGDGVEGALREALVLADATNHVRDWTIRPANTMTPRMLAEAARRLYEGTGLELEVLERADMERERMGALLGVARGSDEPPVMIIVRYDGGRPDGPRLALVGKGITFDTGGISLKPAGGMDLMKNDMGGGAAVLAAMYAIARLGPAVNVVGIVPATENMPGGRAYKPGDVLTSMSGKTIEVTNTDAEGRIILADGLAKARQLGATHIVDTATLTGACIVALGHVAAGMMTNDRELAALVVRAAERAGDRVTELPLFPEYDVCLRSDVADMKNAAGREGGAISAAVFLREFVEDTPWVHLDIASTAWNDQHDQTQIPKGPSGAPVRTLVHLAFEFAQV